MLDKKNDKIGKNDTAWLKFAIKINIVKFEPML